MFFLLRCVFWLGLVFSHIAALEGTSATSLASQGAQAIGGSAAVLGRAAIDAAGDRCRAEPEQCLALAAQAATLGQEAEAKSPSRLASSRDTLNSGDRIPAWRLRTE